MDLKWRVLIAVGFGTYMATLDFNIVSVALPTLSDEFHRSPDTVLWAMLASNLVITGLTLTAGRAGDLFGRKRLYLAGWIIFTIGLCFVGTAQNIDQLIAYRFFQGAGVALAIANGNAIVTDVFPDSERGRALGTIGAIVGAGLMCGPIFGGVILSFLSWRWIFWLRVPIGFVAFAAAWRLIPDEQRKPAGQKLDVPGAIALFIGLSGTLIAVNRGGSWGWASPAVLGLFALSAAAIVAFLRVEANSSSPIVALPLFKVPTFSAPVLALLLTFVGQAAAIFLMPFYLEDIKGYSTASTGLVISVVPFAMILLSSASGYAADRWNFRFQTTVGTLIVMAGLFSLATLRMDSPLWAVTLRLAIIGIGTSIFMAPNTSTLMGSVDRTMLGTASAASATSRNIGNAVGLAMSGAILVGVGSAAAGIAGIDPADLPPAAMLDGIRVAFLAAGVGAVLATIVTLFAGTLQPEPVRITPVPATGTPLIAGGANGDGEGPAFRSKSQR